MDACLDTAPFGDLAAWDHPPTEPRIVDGWLYGRGAADCKVAVAIFSHLAAYFQQLRDNLSGRLLVLFDADKHTGDLAGVKTFLHSYPQLDGVLIGYLGNYGVIVGARGFYRATVTVHGVGGHSGGRQAGAQNAILKAALLVQSLAAASLPMPTSDAFPLSPSLTVTGICGGESFSTKVPDRCDVNVASGHAASLSARVAELAALPTVRSRTGRSSDARRRTRPPQPADRACRLWSVQHRQLLRSPPDRRHLRVRRHVRKPPRTPTGASSSTRSR